MKKSRHYRKETHPEGQEEGRTSMTRRAMLTGGSMAALGAMVGCGHTTMPGRPAPKPPFDIRDSVPDAALDDDCLQCIYDTVNRMVLLIGDIAFIDLFGLPMGSLVPRIAPRISQAAGYGLLRNPDRVEELAGALQSRARESTIADFFISPRSQVAPDTLTLLIQIRREGIQIPLPLSEGRSPEPRRVALEQLVEAAPDLTFQELFTRSKEETPQNVTAAVQSIRIVGLFAWWNNNRCCDRGGGAVPGTDVCVVNTGTWCNLPGPSRSFCSIGSDICVPDNPNGPG